MVQRTAPMTLVRAGGTDSASKGADKREGDKSSTSGQSPRSGEPSENDGEGAGYNMAEISEKGGEATAKKAKESEEKAKK